MGFSIEVFFEDLIKDLERAQKDQQTISNILDEVYYQYQYFRECDGTVEDIE